MSETKYCVHYEMRLCKCGRRFAVQVSEGPRKNRRKNILQKVCGFLLGEPVCEVCAALHTINGLTVH